MCKNTTPPREGTNFFFKDSPTGTISKPWSRGLQFTNNNTQNVRGKEQKEEEEEKEEDEKGSEKKASERELDVVLDLCSLASGMVQHEIMKIVQGLKLTGKTG